MCCMNRCCWFPLLRTGGFCCCGLCPQAKGEVKKLIEKAQSNDLEAQPGRTLTESFENQASGGGACFAILRQNICPKFQNFKIVAAFRARAAGGMS
jgi:hypothetical protein